MTTNLHSKKMAAVLAAAAIALGMSCESLDSTDLNNPNLDSLTTKPTRAGILAASTGLLIGHRQQVAQTNGFVSLLGILGRESYCFDKADPRFITEMLEASGLDASSPAFGGNEWQQPYQNIRNAFTLLGALDAVSADPITGITASEKTAITGYAETMQALDFLVIYNTRWDQGGPIDVNRGIEDTPAPVENRQKILDHVIFLLDDGANKLAAGGSFPFPMSNGFAGFDDPVKFRKVNRAIKARAAVYKEDWVKADEALAESFLNASPATLDLRQGVYHSFGTGSGDVVNNLVSPNIVAHPKLVTEAEAGDLRVTQKLTRIVDSKGVPITMTSRNLETGYKFKLYTTPSSPVPIIRNEELILLRAETRFHLGDVTGAYEDLNLIRQVSGGLGQVAESTDAATFTTELLKQRRYSLMFEGGHRWIDLRRLNRTNDPGLLDIPSPPPEGQNAHHFSTFFPIPLAECLARGPGDPTVAGKCSF